MPRKRVERERPSRYAVKAPDVLLSNWVGDVYEHWRDRDPSYELVANAVRHEVLGRLNELKSNVQRILRGDKIDHVQQVRTLEAARLLLYGRDLDYRRQVNLTPPDKVPPEPDLATAESVIANLTNQIANMPVSEWRSKLDVLRDEIDPGGQG